jgi:hypothetical protein
MRGAELMALALPMSFPEDRWEDTDPYDLMGCEDSRACTAGAE